MDGHEITAISAALATFSKPIYALEWGSGNSSIYFSSLMPNGSLWAAYEHDANWHEEIATRLKSSAVNSVELTLIPPSLPFDGLSDGDFAGFKEYILAPIKKQTNFDFVLVDGRARVECLAVGWEMLQQNGIMVLHDAQRAEYSSGIPKPCYWVRIVNPAVLNEGPISTLFIFRNPILAAEIATRFTVHLPSNITVIKNIDDSTANQHEVTEIRNNATASTTETAPKKAIQAKYCLFLNTYYKGFVDSLYAEIPSLTEFGYSIQLQRNQNALFGDSDFYSRGVRNQEWRAEDIIVNIPMLQAAWCRESAYDASGLTVAIEQIRRASPAVTYFQDLSVGTSDFISAIRPYTGLIVGQIASPIPPQADLRGFDILFSSFPHFVERFRKEGHVSYYQPLAFDPIVLQSIETTPYESRTIECSFIGGITGLHTNGTKLLELLIATTPIRLWGYGAEYLPSGSCLLERHNGEAWGLGMFRLMADSRITVNRHIDVAENYANNMRLFEATGCGALLITDYKDNLNDLFAIGTEIVVYRSPDECAALINYYLANPEEAKKIADAGQRRTLSCHTYSLRMQQTVEILERHIMNETSKFLSIPWGRVSDGQASILANEVTSAMEHGWQDVGIPLRQRALVQAQLAQMYQGASVLPFGILTDILQPILDSDSLLLEIGCSSGYYYEVLTYLLSRQFKYWGVDYSPAMIDMAKDHYPRANFVVSDGANLPFSNCQFDIVVSGSILGHTLNYKEQINETARVSGTYIVVHRMLICKKRPTQFMKKYAYEVEVIEVRFNQAEILEIFRGLSFELESIMQYAEDLSQDEYEATFLFKKLKSRI